MVNREIMSEDFVRCPNCGNLNIIGTNQCVFCDTELPDTGDAERGEIETFPCPGCKSELPTTVASCPICGWINEAVKDAVEEPSRTPDIPEVSSIPELPIIPDEEIVEKKKEAVIDEEKPSWTFGRITVLSLIIVGLSLAHYGLNILLSFVSIDVVNSNVQLYPNISEPLSNYIHFNPLSILLNVILLILVGYFISKIARKYFESEKNIIYFIALIVFVDIIINCGASALLIYILYVTGSLGDVLLIYFVGALFIFVVFSVMTLFLPLIAGSFRFYKGIDRIFYPRKYKISI